MHPEIRVRLQVQRTRQDAAAGMECLSRLGEGEEHRARPDAGADVPALAAIRPAAAGKSERAQEVRSPQAARERARAEAERDAPAVPGLELSAQQPEQTEVLDPSWVLLRRQAKTRLARELTLQEELMRGGASMAAPRAR